MATTLGTAGRVRTTGVSRAHRAGVPAPRPTVVLPPLPGRPPGEPNGAVDPITVLLADDNLIVREGVRALLARDADRRGRRASPATTTSWSHGRDALRPQVLVTDIRMPPTFQNEGIEARQGGAQAAARHRRRGAQPVRQTRSTPSRCWPTARPVTPTCSRTGSPTATGSAARSARWPPAARCSTRRSCGRWSSPARDDGELTPAQEELLRQVAEGRPVKAIAASPGATPEAVNDAIEALFLTLAKGASAGQADALRRLRMLHTAILEREEQGETLSRLLPGGLAEQAAHRPGRDRPHRAARRSPC